MKTAIIVGLLLAVTSFPGTVAEESPETLIQRNMDWLIEQVGDAYYPDEISSTSVGEMRLEDAMRMAAEFYAVRSIDLPSVEIPVIAGQGDFPLAGYGVILELGAGGGTLPGRCSTHTSELNLISGAIPPATVFSKNGYGSTSMSTFTQLDLAIGTDPLLLTLDIVTNWNADIIYGPNYDNFCFDFQFCFWGFCFWIALNAAAFEGVAHYDLVGL